MKYQVDLHIHTIASDGLHTPGEVVAMSRAAGLRAIAITDHDTVDGLVEANEAATGTELEVIPGVEISTEVAQAEIHILGYFVNYSDAKFAARLAEFRNSRVERARVMLARLDALGISLSWEQVRELAGDGALGRPHIARAMEASGHVRSVQEAFDRYLGRGKPAYVPRFKAKPVEAIRLIRQAQGLPILAHPWEATPLLPELVSEGLIGLEAYYANYASEVVSLLCKQAKQYGLLCTGGSDFHGIGLLPENRLGCAHVPIECVQALKERKCLLERRPPTVTGIASCDPGES